LLLTAEILFIGLVAVLAWLADFGPVLAATAVGVAWLLAATFELVRWRRVTGARLGRRATQLRARRPRGGQPTRTGG
jgi:hypothetical protein